MQNWYDFGMRALKSVLVMAGSLKRANPELPEDVVLIRAMRDSNLPKFLAPDVELFSNIIGDLFPKVRVPDQVRGKAAGGELDVLAALWPWFGWLSSPATATAALVYGAVSVASAMLVVTVVFVDNHVRIDLSGTVLLCDSTQSLL